MMKVNIVTDAGAAIRRMVSDEPGPGERHELEARKWVAHLGAAAPDLSIEIRWYPAHEGVAGNERADEEARQAGSDGWATLTSTGGEGCPF